jgi:invasion protein IalB
MPGRHRLLIACALALSLVAAAPVDPSTSPASVAHPDTMPPPSVVVPAVPPEGLAVFDDWKKLCEPAPDKSVQVCFGFQKVSYTETKAQLLQAVVGYFRTDRADPTLIVTIPLGAFLLPGLEIRTKGGKKPIHSDFQYCFSNGCQAAIRLDSAKLDLLKRESEAEVVFLDAGHQRISVPLSLKGLSAVLDALKPRPAGG